MQRQLQGNIVCSICKHKPVSSQARKAMAHVVIICMDYLNNRDGSNSFYEQVIGEIIPIYNGEVVDFTGGCQLYYTPASMTPAGSPPNWNFSVLEEVSIQGVDSYYEGRFYRYR